MLYTHISQKQFVIRQKKTNRNGNIVKIEISVYQLAFLFTVFQLLVILFVISEKVVKFDFKYCIL